jgi:organic radical activating enzyme
MNNFFCAAKWDELYLYLNHGNTNSCHHPIPHRIPIDEIQENVAALHNTRHKMNMQQLMLTGQAPEECHMCWHIEKSNPNAKSDRFLKNQLWKKSVDEYTVDPNYVPKLIEVVFDNLCNLNCSYCDSGQSSSWAAAMNKLGPFDLETDYRQLYQTVYVKPGYTDPEYLDAWNRWWPTIKNQVQVLKFSGGEPLISPNFWRTLEEIKNDNLDIAFSLNSNFSVDPKYIKKLADFEKNLKEITITASIDSVGAVAEFTRAGLNFDLFDSNVRWWSENTGNGCSLSLQSTVNIFAIWGFKEKLKYNLQLKDSYGKHKITEFYTTVVRFPEFQSINLLPPKLKEYLYNDINEYYLANKNQFEQNEQTYAEKIINYLTDDPKPLRNLSTDSLKQDLKQFTKKYQTLSKHRFEEIFPKNFVEWMENI